MLKNLQNIVEPEVFLGEEEATAKHLAGRHSQLLHGSRKLYKPGVYDESGRELAPGFTNILGRRPANRSIEFKIRENPEYFGIAPKPGVEHSAAEFEEAVQRVLPDVIDLSEFTQIVGRDPNFIGKMRKNGHTYLPKINKYTRGLFSRENAQAVASAVKPYLKETYDADPELMSVNRSIDVINKDREAAGKIPVSAGSVLRRLRELGVDPVNPILELHQGKYPFAYFKKEDIAKVSFSFSDKPVLGTDSYTLDEALQETGLADLNKLLTVATTNRVDDIRGNKFGSYSKEAIRELVKRMEHARARTASGKLSGAQGLGQALGLSAAGAATLAKKRGWTRNAYGDYEQADIDSELELRQSLGLVSASSIAKQLGVVNSDVHILAKRRGWQRIDGCYKLSDVQPELDKRLIRDDETPEIPDNGKFNADSDTATHALNDYVRLDKHLPGMHEQRLHAGRSDLPEYDLHIGDGDFSSVRLDKETRQAYRVGVTPEYVGTDGATTVNEGIDVILDAFGIDVSMNSLTLGSSDTINSAYQDLSGRRGKINAFAHQVYNKVSDQSVSDVYLERDIDENEQRYDVSAGGNVLHELAHVAFLKGLVKNWDKVDELRRRATKRGRLPSAYAGVNPNEFVAESALLWLTSKQLVKDRFPEVLELLTMLSARRITKSGLTDEVLKHLAGRHNQQHHAGDKAELQGRFDSKDYLKDELKKSLSGLPESVRDQLTEITTSDVTGRTTQIVVTALAKIRQDMDELTGEEDEVSKNRRARAGVWRTGGQDTLSAGVVYAVPELRSLTFMRNNVSICLQLADGAFTSETINVDANRPRNFAQDNPQEYLQQLRVAERLVRDVGGGAVEAVNGPIIDLADMGYAVKVLEKHEATDYLRSLEKLVLSLEGTDSISSIDARRIAGKIKEKGIWTKLEEDFKAQNAAAGSAQSMSVDDYVNATYVDNIVLPGNTVFRAANMLQSPMRRQAYVKKIG